MKDLIEVTGKKLKDSGKYLDKLPWEREYGVYKELDKVEFEERILVENPRATDNFIEDTKTLIKGFNRNNTLYKVSDSIRMRSGYLLVDTVTNKELAFLSVIYY